MKTCAVGLCFPNGALADHPIAYRETDASAIRREPHMGDPARCGKKFVLIGPVGIGEEDILRPGENDFVAGRPGDIIAFNPILALQGP